MVGSGCFDHVCRGEADLGRRLEVVDYLTGGLTRWIYGENIAWGSGKLGAPKEIVKAWMNSPPHRANLLTNSFEDVGIGFRAGTPKHSGDSGATTQPTSACGPAEPAPLSSGLARARCNWLHVSLPS